MATHTPGPWVADAIAENGDIRIACVNLPLVIASTHNGASIGEILNGLPPELQWANARLIAAAPELLDALRMFVAAEDDWNARDGTFDDPLTDAYLAARAAIAKATGEAA
jgi:hypothetical protein